MFFSVIIVVHSLPINLFMLILITFIFSLDDPSEMSNCGSSEPKDASFHTSFILRRYQEGKLIMQLRPFRQLFKSTGLMLCSFILISIIILVVCVLLTKYAKGKSTPFYSTVPAILQKGRRRWCFSQLNVRSCWARLIFGDQNTVSLKLIAPTLSSFEMWIDFITKFWYRLSTSVMGSVQFKEEKVTSTFTISSVWHK